MTKSQNFKTEFSAGAVVFKKTSAGFKFLIGKHSGYHKWVLPKGLIEKGEKGYMAALRETEEEMGIKARLITTKPIIVIKYMYLADFKAKSAKQKSKTASKRVMTYQEDGGKKTKVFKTVSFYLAKYLSGDPKNHDWEMETVSWFIFEKALSMLAFKGERQALEKAQNELVNPKK
ncbi:NUDIX domain-containing protein [Patescibacteria group bacterium]